MLGVSVRHRADCLDTVASELAKYNLDLMAAQEIRWDKGGSQAADDYTFLYGNRSANHHLGTAFSYVMVSYQQLRG
jgi:hypothetical protein